MIRRATAKAKPRAAAAAPLARRSGATSPERALAMTRTALRLPTKTRTAAKRAMAKMLPLRRRPNQVRASASARPKQPPRKRREPRKRQRRARSASRSKAWKMSWRTAKTSQSAEEVAHPCDLLIWLCEQSERLVCRIRCARPSNRRRTSVTAWQSAFVCLALFYNSLNC